MGWVCREGCVLCLHVHACVQGIQRKKNKVSQNNNTTMNACPPHNDNTTLTVYGTCGVVHVSMHWMVTMVESTVLPSHKMVNA